MLSSLEDKALLDLKSSILNQCKKMVDEKLGKLISSLNEVSESSNSESKSSAGDKHETSKAMMQIEQEKLGKQIAEVENQKNELEKIVPGINRKNMAKGSLIESTQGIFLIAIAAGKISVKNIQVTVISLSSPIAKELMLGKAFTFNNLLYSVQFFA